MIIKITKKTKIMTNTVNQNNQNTKILLNLKKGVKNLFKTNIRNLNMTIMKDNILLNTSNTLPHNLLLNKGTNTVTSWNVTTTSSERPNNQPNREITATSTNRTSSQGPGLETDRAKRWSLLIKPIIKENES